MLQLNLPSLFLKEGRARLWFLLIGVNEYRDPNLPNLNCAVADCLGLAETLDRATQKFPAKSIFVHCDPGSAFVPAGADCRPATLAAIATTLKEILARANPQDTLLLYFAGHGLLELESNELYLCLTETQRTNLAATSLNVQTFLLSQLKGAQIQHQVVILDACHSGRVGIPRDGDSGAISRSGQEVIDINEPDPTPQLKSLLEDYAHGSGKTFYAMLSCAANQQSYEFRDCGNGAFTYFLIHGLTGQAADPQGEIYVDPLFWYACEKTRQYVTNNYQRNQAQTPTHISSGSQRIILGLADPDHFPSSSEDAQSTRADRYRSFVRQVLYQRGDLDCLTSGDRQTLQQRAGEWFLNSTQTQSIELEEGKHLQTILHSYRHSAINRLCKEYPDWQKKTDPFKQLRQAFCQYPDTKGLSPEVLQKIEQEVEQTFQQFRMGYFLSYFDRLSQTRAWNLSQEQEQWLQDEQNQLKLSDTTIIELSPSAMQVLNGEARQLSRQFKQFYRRLYLESLRNPEWDSADLLERLKFILRENFLLEEVWITQLNPPLDRSCVHCRTLFVQQLKIASSLLDQLEDKAQKIKESLERKYAQHLQRVIQQHVTPRSEPGD